MNDGGSRGEAVEAAELLERLVARLSASAGVSAVYGSPIEADGVTIVPVAKVRFGFGAGAGSGRRRSEAGRGGGGGGGAGATAAGYVEIKDGSATFKAVRRPVKDLFPAAVAAFVAGAATTSLIRRTRIFRNTRA